MANRFKVEGRFTVVDRFTRPIKKMQRRIGKFTDNVGRGFRDIGRMASKFKVAFIAMGAALAGATVAAGKAMHDVIKTGMDFEQTMASAAAKFGPEVREGTEAFEKLDKAAKDVGATTEFTASQAAGGLRFLAMAGFDAEQATSALPGLVDLATAAELDLARASDIASDSLGAFGLASDDAETQANNLSRINDVLAKTTTSANTDMEQLFETVKMAGPVATNAGASIETFASMAGKMAGGGMKASKAGTAMRSIFLRLASPAAKGEKALKELGVQVKNSEGNMRDVLSIIGDLNKGLEGMGDVEKSAKLKDIFGQRAIAGASLLLEEGEDSLKAYRGELEDSGGAASEMAKVMRDTTEGDLKSMNSAIEAIKLELFELVKGPLRELLQGLTEWFRANKDVISSGLKDFIQWLEKNSWAVVAVLGAIALILVAIAAVILIVVVTAFLLLIPFLLFWAAIMLVIAAVKWLIDNVPKMVKKVGDKLKGMWKEVKDFFRPAVEFIVGLFVIIKQEVKKQLKPIADKAKEVVGKIKDFFRPIKEWFAGVWSDVKEKAGEIWGKLVTKAKGIVEDIKEAFRPIKTFFEDLWNDIKSMFDETVGGVLSQIGSMIDSVRGAGRVALDQGEEAQPQVVPPDERTAKTITESHATTRAEVTVRPERGAQAEVTKKPKKGSGVTLEPSGAM